MADTEKKAAPAQKTPIAEREEKILSFWQHNNIFKKTLEQDAPKGEVVFYDGPPFATGLPHYGHILAGTIKDVIPRYKTMTGHHVPRRWGWDTHGLPIENLIEKELGLTGKKDIEHLGIETFNEAARAAVLRYDAEWKKIVPRAGRWVDMEDKYLTMQPSYMESILWSFKTLYDKGLIYQGFKSMMLCPHCGTTLSNFEVAQGYKDITDISVYVKFQLADEPDTCVLAWTTTPWTLPGNVALAVHPDVQYVQVDVTKEGKTERVIVAKERLAVLKDPYEIVQEFSGKELIGKKYIPVFSYYQNADIKHKENAWKIVAGDFVTTTDGTGVVHIAPAFGEDDYNVSLKEHLPFIQHVGTDGAFKKEVADFAGQLVKPKGDHQKADIEIIKYLAGKGSLFAKEKLVHSYPHCWRCDTPLLNYASSSWFVKVTDLKDKLIAENKTVNWVPPDIGEGRFGKWLEGAKDWAISRSRFWGAPLPVWICKECYAIEVLGSIAEIEKRSGKKPVNRNGEIDLHRPYIDEVTFSCSCGGDMKRVPEVFDTWYESGSMPYAQSHYPFDKERMDAETGKGFPAHFIAEGIDQTRGWFYSLLVLSVALFGKTPYRSVIVNGTVLAEDGQKMSKRLKNYPDVEHIFNKYGADAMRYYLLASPVVKGEDFAFAEKGVDEVMKKITMRLDNVYSFYSLYAEPHAAYESEAKDSEHVLDQWILARLGELAHEVTQGLETYVLDRATRPFMNFIDDLSTWYLRRSRDRFKGDDEDDRQFALATTRFVLRELSKLLAPFMPFLAEDIYQKVQGKEGKESVHLESWPAFEVGTDEQQALIRDMQEVRNIVSLALEARASANIKIRQPLARLSLKNTILAENQDFAALIKDEVNVKEVVADPAQEAPVVLDTTITPGLRLEGQARELIRALQDTRKKAGLNPQDVIVLSVATHTDGKKVLEAFEKDIKKTANVADISFVESLEGEKVNADGIEFVLAISKK